MFNSELIYKIKEKDRPTAAVTLSMLLRFLFYLQLIKGELLFKSKQQQQLLLLLLLLLVVVSTTTAASSLQGPAVISSLSRFIYIM